jgi:protein-S-isoprenylcysteine O-methyltransferase Ste14
MTATLERSQGRGRLRLVALYVLIGGLLAFARPTPTALGIGFALVSAGEALRAWAAGYLRKNTELVTAGPYRYVRNPLYLGRVLIFTGLVTMAWLPHRLSLLALAVGYAVFFGVYMRRKELVEPARLRRLHGDAYERYHRAVPAVWPSLTPYDRPSSSCWAWERFLRNREHWMFLGLLGVSAFLVWRGLFS